MDAGLRPADATYGAPGAVTRHGLGDTLRQALPDALRHAPGGITRHHTLADATREPDPRQAEIHRLMIRHAQAGRTVVRLKGGDPFVFGRGGEEATVLRQHGIPFEIVPGVSSAVAVPAYAGIPLTYRGLATGFTVVTGHEALHSTGVAWDVLARSEQTLVILMGVGHLAGIVERLIAAGRDRETPAAVIASGTTQRQRSVVTTLGEIDAAVRRAGIRAPAVVVIGPVARLAEHLAWFSPAPPVAPQAGAPQAGAPQAGAPRTAPPPAAAAPQAAAPPRR
ncbi:uroporphyrinogen-III C-methyltransferase [Alicyclobacillus sp.]|uniref:uroporphyrinogen-III C-methyltransferase n=1 Tax=Alicyclobacillus sp. TaxID=61169 RepID=UPI0025C73D71|nr:uroporphyrinogen-III C-methyltransferase [Alicyclobacillus sp.]